MMQKLNLASLLMLFAGCISCTHAGSVGEESAAYEGATGNARLSVRDSGRSLEIRPGADGPTSIVPTLNGGNYRCALVAGIAVCAVLDSSVDGVVPTSDGGQIVIRPLRNGNRLFIVKYDPSKERSCDYTIWGVQRGVVEFGTTDCDRADELSAMWRLTSMAGFFR